ncbi:hypothetical protein F4801DRAFT_18209 [Xylaria longipes]|nr:hypothetical protein F4801DRAFT_18209 [Xylaria longipes]
MATTRRSNRRYASDELRFTGIDMGVSRSRNKYAYRHSDDDNDLTESDSQATSNESEDETRAELENALVQSALARIRKARARGKQDVKLNKGEVAALERRRKRLESEAKAKDRKRRKENERRVAVPLSHFDSALSNHGGLTTSDDNVPRPPPPSTMPIQGQPGPPMGLFLPPSTSQARPRSSTPSSHRSSYQHHGSSSPFDYQYVSPGSNIRHVSDTQRPSSSLKTLPPEEDWRSQSLSSHTALDPFQYQTAGPSTPHLPGAEAYGDMSLSGHPTTARSGSGQITPEDNDTGSDDQRDGRQIDRNLRSDDVIVVEAGPFAEQKLRRSRNSSPSKRKHGGGRRRKDK